jgi:excisionase family DNA binding protein
VTVGELTDYWDVSRKQICRLIDSGKLTAVRFGPWLFRVPRAEALKLEEALRVVSLGKALPAHRRSQTATQELRRRPLMPPVGQTQTTRQTQD